MRVTSSGLVDLDITKPMPPVIINSWDYNWVIPALKAGEVAWLDTSDLKQTWIAMSRAAESVNMAIYTGEVCPSTCNCPPDTIIDTSHPCTNCGKLNVCSEL
jgi:hypothetical protein